MRTIRLQGKQLQSASTAIRGDTCAVVRDAKQHPRKLAPMAKLHCHGESDVPASGSEVQHQQALVRRVETNHILVQ